MTDSDSRLQKAVGKALAAAERVPAAEFDAVWAAAVARAGIARKRRLLLSGSAAAAAIAVIAFVFHTPAGDEWRYVDRHQLLETTGWSAPSDSLLPHREFDIYQSVPVLIESTETYGGTLL
jgi:hypothetical protein